VNVRGLVKAAANDIREGDLTPGRASDLLAQLTSLLATVLQEIREADVDYANVLLKYLDSDEAANRAKIRAMVTPEYARAREAKDTQVVLVELIRSLKIILKAQTEEMRLQGLVR
jgi:hypothetical protein